ncbi:MAG: TonB-dependent receptor [Sphingomicrobium sp.]
MSNRILKGSLLTTTVIAGMAFAAPAFAQDATNAPNQPAAAPSPTTPGETVASQAPADTTGPAANEVVVTGTLIKAVTTPSPVTTLTISNLDQRGISTVQEGIQRIASNNGPALTNSFTANGAFAAGASAVSLRGLSTNSTLVLFDGMRAAYYPLADDGTRNFVDLNTIPDDIVERVEILRDGASSTYGADAIAGVVNIITKKNVQGVSARLEGGISSRGDAQQLRGSVTAGFGDLYDKGINAYISGMFYKSDMLYNRDRPYPYNTDDFSKLCTEPDVCGSNGVINGLQYDGTYSGGFGSATPFAVRPRNAATGGAVVPARTRYTYLSGCPGFPTYTPTAAELALPVNAAAPASGPVCQEDVTQMYGVISPEIKRFGISGRVTARITDTLEGYVSANFLQSSSFDTYLTGTIRANAPAPFYNIRYSTSANVLAYGNNTVLQLPVYICPRTTPGPCTAANGVLNPNNPYAAQGQTAAIIGRIPNLFEQNFSRTRAYRAAAGVRGTVAGWDFGVNATGMHIDLLRKYNGYVYIQNLLDLVKDGSYNFRDPMSNSQATLDYLSPENRGTSTSDLFQFDANANRPVAELPGGPLTVAVGASVRYEAVDSPSINSDIHGGTQRYFRLNGFALKGDRTVLSTYGEINAPVLTSLTLNVSGRFDKYPNGISNFSPKAGFVFKPLGRMLTLRGTASKGFRIPSFGEGNATYPTTGFVTANKGIYEDFFLNQYGCSLATYSTCPTYVTTTSYGATSLSNPNLKPEKSKSFTAGAVVEPLRGVQLSVDFYTIKKNNVITTAPNTPALSAYYGGQPIPAGYIVVPDAVDPNNPNALPRIAFVQSQFINANTQKVSGFDFGLNVNRNLTNSIRMTTTAEASYIRRLSMSFPDGHTERYDGTLGNFNLTAGSGTPKWKGVWTTALEFNKLFTVAGTVNYFGGYDLSAMDQGTEYKDCGLSDGSIPCHVKRYITFDLNTQFKLNNRFTFYTVAQNILDKMPPIDTITYGAHGYNPVQGGEGIYGRYFKAGVKMNF